MERIFYYHVRPDLLIPNWGSMSNKQKRSYTRATICGIVNGSTMRIGVAECSHKDAFNKKRGRIISHGRAIHSLSTIINIEDQTKAHAEFVSHCKFMEEAYNGVSKTSIQKQGIAG